MVLPLLAERQCYAQTIAGGVWLVQQLGQPLGHERMIVNQNNCRA
jgi:hypothetical protein